MTMLNAIPRGATNRKIVRRGVVILLTRIGRLINRWIAAAIARHERHADLFSIRRLNDRELKDIGLYRDDIGGTLAEAAKYRNRMQQFR
ncbi:MAG: hypothetical protein E8A46_11610 [Bradyrhizobium sp.]|jgi:uncharacterized protein YjiS (DUF1127 family)|uniref:hypothetical protein n=1 Tax=Bradyrhizobium sp. TaxID=376 RepID=UPI00122A71DB|nr:hypothetical protein [Bradyrhizobium sp.]THD53090.1 MAG: hypothetical protein E8A46_11610 [Bradyrhizobium sp.]